MCSYCGVQVTDLCTNKQHTLSLHTQSKETRGIAFVVYADIYVRVCVCVCVRARARICVRKFRATIFLIVP